ncbi:uncharacterized protein EAF01_000438 [Botrytis porri]|nr:uncharacterized protein EAF01_000438 [Botrytis porri]KAF7914032.1 hypothetical protein EAF01_000438 [Botrytis porri]
MSTLIASLISPELSFKEWGFAILVIFILVRIHKQNPLTSYHITSHSPPPPSTPPPTLLLPRSPPLDSHPYPLPPLPLARTSRPRHPPPPPKIRSHHTYRPRRSLFRNSTGLARYLSNQGGVPAFPERKLWHGRKPGSGKPISILHALEPSPHRKFRRAMERAFTERAAGGQEENADASEGAVVDIVRWYVFFPFDLIGDLGFGESFQCLESETYHP